MKYRVGKKQNRVILDENGYKVAECLEGNEDVAKRICDLLNEHGLVSELTKHLVMLDSFEVKPLQVWRHKENKKCTLKVTKVHELSGATSVVFTGDVVEKYNKFLSPDRCGYTGRNSVFQKKKRFLNYELLKN